MNNISQLLLLIIFVAMFIVITMGKVHRYIPALAGAGLTLLVLLFVFRSAESCLAVLNLSDKALLPF